MTGQTPDMATARGVAHKLVLSDGKLPHTQLPQVLGFLVLVLVGLISIFFVISGHSFNASVARTLQVRTEAYRLLTLVQDAETGQRGYLLTNNENYLAPYEAGRLEIPNSLRNLRALLTGNPAQAGVLMELSDAIRLKLGELAATVASAKSGDRDAAIVRVQENVGNEYMSRIRAATHRLEAEEIRSQSVLSASVELNNMLLAIATLAGIAVVLGLASYTIVLSRRGTDALLAAQQKLKDVNENLEGLVAERVSELQMANEEIQRFAYIVSHDLRAPLVNVMGFTSELDAVRSDVAGFFKEVEKVAPHLVTPDRKMAIETDLPEALGFIRSSTAKMDRLINAILKLSREGRRVLTPQRIDLRELVEAQGESLSQQLAAGKAELVVQTDLPEIVSDRLAIEQIFGNLIENATKYLAKERPGRIEVSGKTHGGYLRYDIKDNGRGIEAKDYERIFELFRRSGEQDKPGEGIGLAYVRNLARRLGGNVSVQSEYGTGSTFTVTLPSTFQTKARSLR